MRISEGICSNLSFGMTTSESIYFFKNLIPKSACSERLLCSKLKGFETTPTVNAPDSFAAFAMTGAAPVPVPPPTLKVKLMNNKANIYIAEVCAMVENKTVCSGEIICSVGN